VKDLRDAVRIIAKLELNKDLSDQQIDEIVTFLNTLTGEVPANVQKAPNGMSM
jgi:cytochrome c peroxidase